MKKLICILAIFCLLSCSAESMLSACGSHVLYLDPQGTVWAWGSNQKGESVPDSEAERILKPTLVFKDTRSIAAGRQFSYVLDNESTLWRWGSGLEAPEQIDSDVRLMAACEDICAYVCGDTLKLLSGEELITLEAPGIKAVQAGADFVLYLTDDGNAYFYGNNDYLQAGGINEAPVVIMENCASISAHGQTLLFTDAAGNVYAMGASGAEGRLGIDSDDWITEPVSNGLGGIGECFAGVACSGAVDRSGCMYVWGSLYSYVSAFDENGDALTSMVEGVLINYGKTPIALFPNISKLAFGDAFIAALTSDGSVMTWGSNDQGQLGDGYYTSIEYSLDEESEDGTYEITVLDGEQRVFPVYPEFID